ncbi:cancer/testis antigen family 45 member A1-like [Rattus rattus]|uniref:cancer/testis antigen family 45 member A1-like n=1 Tax=Rattus rattus TaxID=10117 RepID=UPI0013F37F11|nr:cancer/testis antigen family 45 member A1-like [Rattus rattus]
MRRIMMMEPVKKREGEPHLKTSVVVKGEEYGRLFEILEEVQGPLEVRIQFVEFSIKEAARFKRHHLIQCLEKKRKEFLSEGYHK